MKTLEIPGRAQTHTLLIDDADYDWISQLHNEIKFRVNKKGYVTRKTMHEDQPTTAIYKNNKKYYRYKITKLHRLLMGLTKGNDKIQVDHIDQNPLNNSRSNLRLCYNAENSKNKKIPCSSRFVGLNYRPERRKPWAVRITFGSGKTQHDVHVGYFENETVAALAYVRAVLDILPHNDPRCVSRISLNLKLLGLALDSNGKIKGF